MENNKNKNDDEPNQIEKKRPKKIISKKKIENLKNQYPMYAIFGKEYFKHINTFKKV